jgi:hypothetical protein
MSTTQNTNNTKVKMNITIHSVNTETLTCTGTCNDHEFTSAPFRWGSKMLMKVTSTHEFTQGEKVSIGHASKKALKAANLVLPEAQLVRPRKPKGEVQAETEPTPEA